MRIAGAGHPVTRWLLALIVAAPFVVVWMLRELNPLLTLFVMLVILDLGAFVGGADSRKKGDWKVR